MVFISDAKLVLFGNRFGISIKREKCNSHVPSFQQHLNIMQSTYKLQASDFVELLK